jgi:hypothetical protein
LEEAVFIRDYLVEHGWSKRNLRIVRSRLWIIFLTSYMVYADYHWL